MKNSDQEKFRKAKYGQAFSKETTKARYEESRNRKDREFVPQHENLIEIKIKQAMHDGKFDNLPGTGKPINFNEMSNVPEHLRAGYQVLKNSGFVPEEVRLKKEMASLKNRIKSCMDEEEIKKLKKQYVEVSNKFHYYMDYNKTIR